jgi:hypothetical protein
VTIDEKHFPFSFPLKTPTMLFFDGKTNLRITTNSSQTFTKLNKCENKIDQSHLENFFEQFSDINADCKNEIKELTSPLLKTLKQQLHNFPENDPSFVNLQSDCSKDLKTSFFQKENISNLESFQKEFPLSPFLCSSILPVSSFNIT